MNEIKETQSAPSPSPPQTDEERALADAHERVTSWPRGYTKAELEAARLDARRLGYPGRDPSQWFDQ
jgi:hypothetical protein